MSLLTSQSGSSSAAALSGSAAAVQSPNVSAATQRSAAETPPAGLSARTPRGASQERWAKRILTTLGLTNVAVVLLICLYLVVSGLPAILEIGPVNFLFGTEWASTAKPPKFGILPFILTSLYGTAIAVVVSLPLGVLVAVTIAKLTSTRVRSFIEPMVDLLASIPSVVYGFIGMLVLVPAIQEFFDLPDGSGLLAATVVLTVMVLPTMVKVTLSALDQVPRDYELSSLALGATPVETAFRVVIPAARSGIAAAVVLGVGRAIGEAMAVMMVAGNASNMPGLFESVRFLTTAVASEMAYSAGLQREALFSIALVLFVFIMVINTLLNLFIKKRGT